MNKMSLGTEVKMIKYTCVVCRKVYYIEPDTELPLGAYLNGMGHWGSGGGPIEAYVDTDCMTTPLSDIVQATYDIEREELEAMPLKSSKPKRKTKRVNGKLAKTEKAGMPWSAGDLRTFKKWAKASQDEFNEALPELIEQYGRSKAALVSKRWTIMKQDMGIAKD